MDSEIYLSTWREQLSLNNRMSSEINILLKTNKRPDGNPLAVTITMNQHMTVCIKQTNIKKICLPRLFQQKHFQFWMTPAPILRSVKSHQRQRQSISYVPAISLNTCEALLLHGCSLCTLWPVTLAAQMFGRIKIR